MDLNKILTLNGRLNALTAPLHRDAARAEQASPLWSDLLLATGLTGLAYALDRLIRPAVPDTLILRPTRLFVIAQQALQVQSPHRYSRVLSGHKSAARRASGTWPIGIGTHGNTF
jgi:hypothetical protein